MKHHVITGGAGFIGANLAASLLGDGHRVLAVDDLSRGRIETIMHLTDNPNFDFRQADCADRLAFDAVLDQVEGITDVWHMAANSDIPAGIADPRIDLHQTFLTTFTILEVMKARSIPNLHFASSSAIYGDFGETIIHEDIGPLLPISNYGAMKLASEAQIRAAVEAFLPRADVFRFPNVIGVPATHGVILDFVHKLRNTPKELQVLGNGTQQKAYLHVDDLVRAMRHIARIPGRYQLFNIGPTDDGVTVRSIAETVRDAASPSASIVFGEDARGWVGDVPRFRYSVDRLIGTGWKPTLSSQEAVQRAVAEIVWQEMGR
ncbi:NAD-dependent epimerase/dehydratase family protein [Brevundimonas sp.]|uniref:NAD-dependent epimerase/dehydratase family protein n=1 Tax=Brevundimonas sp. TaxID=1871086 RepID=UPI001AC2CD81|nr:NAD-dependent epimerase/dehydratase family protein [Brevundimonas sp.]MBN9464767.1 NAD-dependent epimerase/dehydratase family protein [Brevundimonas sp.]